MRAIAIDRGHAHRGALHHGGLRLHHGRAIAADHGGLGLHHGAIWRRVGRHEGPWIGGSLHFVALRPEMKRFVGGIAVRGRRGRRGGRRVTAFISKVDAEPALHVSLSLLAVMRLQVIV